MAMGQDFVVLCLECVPDLLEQKALVKSLESDGKEIIYITFEQVKAFAGNMLELRKPDGTGLTVMSEQAFKSMEPEQINQLKQYTDFMYSPIPIIEKYGGGSVRCMMAEIFLEPKSI